MNCCTISHIFHLVVILSVSHGQFSSAHDEGEHDTSGFGWGTGDQNEEFSNIDNELGLQGQGDINERSRNEFSEDSWRFTRNSVAPVNDTRYGALKYGFPVGNKFDEVCSKRMSLQPNTTVEDVVQGLVDGCAIRNESSCEIQRVKQYKNDADLQFKTYTNHPKKLARELFDLQGISDVNLFQCLVYKSCVTRKGQSDLCPRPCSSAPCSKIKNTSGECMVRGFGLLVSDWDCFCKSGYAWDPQERNCEVMEAEDLPTTARPPQATLPSYTSTDSPSLTINATSTTHHLIHSRVKRAAFVEADWKVVKGGCPSQKTFKLYRHYQRDACAAACWRTKICITFVVIPLRKGSRYAYMKNQYSCFLKNGLCKDFKTSTKHPTYVFIKKSFVPMPRPPPTMIPPIAGWKAWGPWHSCRPSCGETRKAPRYRACNAMPCYGQNMEFQHCKRLHCPPEGQWTPWTSWTVCPVTCNGGTVTRKRECKYTAKHVAQNAPKPYCKGEISNEEKKCNTHHCPTWPPTTPWEITFALPTTTMSPSKRRRLEEAQRAKAENAAYDRKILHDVNNKQKKMDAEYKDYQLKLAKEKLEKEQLKLSIERLKGTAKHKKGKGAFETDVPSGGKMSKLGAVFSKGLEEEDEDSDNGTKVMVGIAAAAGVMLIVIVIVVVMRKKATPPPPPAPYAPVAPYYD